MAFSAEMRAVREDQHEAQDPKPLLMNVAAFAIALFAGVAATAYVLRGSAQSTHGLQSSTLSSSAIAPALQINSENKYSLRDGVQCMIDLYTYVVCIIEHKITNTCVFVAQRIYGRR
jgi:hypothetical protein